MTTTQSIHHRADPLPRLGVAPVPVCGVHVCDMCVTCVCGVCAYLLIKSTRLGPSRMKTRLLDPACCCVSDGECESLCEDEGEDK